MFTDAQKFKVKFNECKEQVRKNLEGTGTWKLNYRRDEMLRFKFELLFLHGTALTFNIFRAPHQLD